MNISPALNEAFEETAWTSMYQAVSSDFARQMGFEQQQIGPDTLFFCTTVEMAKFNMVFSKIQLGSHLPRRVALTRPITFAQPGGYGTTCYPQE